jgi:hypothetical protein
MCAATSSAAPMRRFVPERPSDGRNKDRSNANPFISRKRNLTKPNNVEAQEEYVSTPQVSTRRRVTQVILILVHRVASLNFA